MPGQNYVLNYDVSSAVAAAQAIDQLVAALTRLDQIATIVAPKIKGLATGAPKAINATATSATALFGALDRVNTSAKAAGTSLQTIQGNAIRLNTGFRTAADGGMHLSATFARVAFASALLQGLRNTIRAIADAFEEARAYAEKTAGGVSELNEKLRELKAIQGIKVTAKDVRDDVVKLMVATGMKDKEAIDFDVMWRSAIEGAKEKGNWRLNVAETEKARTAAAGFAVAQNIAPDVMGQLVPSIAAAQPIRSADELMGQIAAVDAANKKANSKLTPMLKAEEKVMNALVRPGGGGAFASVGELAGAASAMSVSTEPGRVPQALAQIWGTLAAPKTEQQKKTFKALDLKGGFNERLQALEPLFAAGRAQGKDDRTILREAGFMAGGARGANEAIINAFQSRDIMRTRIKAGVTDADPKSVERIVAAWKQDAGAERMNQAALFAAEQRRGEETQRYEEARAGAEAFGVARMGFGRPSMKMAENIQDLKIPLLNASIAQFMGQEDAHQKMQNAVMVGRLREAIPGIEKRFPRLANQPGILNTFGMGPEAERLPSKEDLTKILNKLTPEELEKFNAVQRQGAVTPRQTGLGAPGGAPVGPAVGPQAGLPGLGGEKIGPAAWMDSEAMGIQRAQQRALESIDRKLGGQRPSVAARTELPQDGGAIEPKRV